MATGTKKDPWTSLTWEDLESWVGTRTIERGRAYQREDRVKRLTRASDGRLLATVYGTDRYFVALCPPEKGVSPLPRSECTCPVGLDCKHAIATIAAYRHYVKEHSRIPPADPDDPRWKKIRDSFDQDVEWDDDPSEFDDPYDGDEPSFNTQRPSTPPRKPLDKSLIQFLTTRSPTELIALLTSLAEQHPEVRNDLREARLYDEKRS